MSTFGEAYQAKLSLKMIFSNYAWYNSISVLPDGDEWCVSVNVERLDNSIKKIIPIVHKGIAVKMEVETGKKKK